MFLVRVALALLVLVPLSSVPLLSQSQPEAITIDTKAAAHPFPHFWEQMFGSGRAILSLRDGYRSDLREVKKATDFEYVRFHAILHDETGVYDEDKSGNPVYNFSYIDQIYDGLLKNGVRPMVEISFMPKKLAARQDIHPFWYHQVVSPPKDYKKWDDLMHAFAQHLVDRYGIDEVAKWYFEVWNEPNIDFWSGEPKQATYFELYDHTARDLKAVNSRLRVGGPATAAAHWIPEFLKHVAENSVPIDFVSTHGYADDSVKDMFGTDENIPMDQRVCRAVKKVHGEIAASTHPKLPLMWTEWNVPSFDELHARDTTYVGAALADDITQCDGLVNMMSFWTFSDVFEEGGPGKEPFAGSFGLMALGGIKKPSYAGFALLHKLGDERLDEAAPGVLVTRRKDGTLAVAVWNLVDPDKQGSPRKVTLHITGVAPGSRVGLSKVDDDHGNTLGAYKKMGSPRYPTQMQIKELNAVVESNHAENTSLKNGSIALVLQVNGLYLLEIGK